MNEGIDQMLAGTPSRRAFLKATAAGSFAAFVLGSCSDDPSTTRPSKTLPSTTVALDRFGSRPISRDAFIEPRRIESRDGVLEATLRITAGTIALAGRAHRGAINVNGEYCGPSLHVRAGDVMRINLVNDSDEPANLHFHGLHVSPKGKSDNVFRHAAPGETLQFEVEIPRDHTGGLNWYHSHIHGMSIRQIDRGFFGLIHIEAGHTQLEAFAELPRRFLAISHLQLDEQGDLAPTPLVLTPVDNVADSYDLVNGQLGQELSLHSGESEYWHIAGLAGQWWYELSLEGHEFIVVAEDGNPYRSPVRAKTLLLSPAKRYEVVVTAGAPGVYALRNAGHDVDGVFYDNASTLGTMVVTKSTETEKLPTLRVPNRIVGWSDLRDTPIANRRTIRFSETLVPFTRIGAAPSLLHQGDNMPGMRNIELEQAIKYNMTFDFFLNGTRYDPTVTNTRVRLGDVEEWELVNDSTTDHPFHIHTNPFQIVERNGKAVDAPSMADVGILEKSGQLKFLIRFADYDGDTLYHCHNLFHEDQGMMAKISIT